MKKVFLIATGLFLLFGLLFTGAYFWLQNQIGPAIVSADNTPRYTFTIPKGQTNSETINKLYNAHLINNISVAKLYLRLYPQYQKILPGDYLFSANLSLKEIFNILNVGPKDIWVTIPEGWRREEVVARLHNSVASIDPAEFLNKTANLEGQLFPDTYLIPAQASAADTVRILTANLINKTHLDISKIYEIPFDGTNATLSGQQILVLASLVEREGKTDSDRPVIAGILLRRLLADWPLQVDATLQYALGTQHCQNADLDCDWWQPPPDSKVPSAYNTYIYKGLPPTPICNPGMAAIDAVLHPQTSPFWYYLAGRDGVTHYAKTLLEHNQNITKYL